MNLTELELRLEESRRTKKMFRMLESDLKDYLKEVKSSRGSAYRSLVSKVKESPRLVLRSIYDDLYSNKDSYTEEDFDVNLILTPNYVERFVELFNRIKLQLKGYK